MFFTAVEVLDDEDVAILLGLVGERDFKGFFGDFGVDFGIAGADAASGQAGGGAEVQGGGFAGGERREPVGAYPFEGAVGLAAQEAEFAGGEGGCGFVFEDEARFDGGGEFGAEVPVGAAVALEAVEPDAVIDVADAAARSGTQRRPSAE